MYRSPGLWEEGWGQSVAFWHRPFDVQSACLRVFEFVTNEQVRRKPNTRHQHPDIRNSKPENWNPELEAAKPRNWFQILGFGFRVVGILVSGFGSRGGQATKSSLGSRQRERSELVAGGQLALQNQDPKS